MSKRERLSNMQQPKEARNQKERGAKEEHQHTVQNAPGIIPAINGLVVLFIHIRTHLKTHGKWWSSCVWSQCRLMGIDRKMTLVLVHTESLNRSLKMKSSQQGLWKLISDVAIPDHDGKLCTARLYPRYFQGLLFGQSWFISGSETKQWAGWTTGLTLCNILHAILAFNW